MNGASEPILVVEDDPAINNILTEFLRDEGYQILSADTGKQALRLIEKNRFSLITLDLGLPDMSGNDFLRELDRSKYARMLANVPVLIISANVHNLRHNSHVKSVMSKPFNLNDLIYEVERLLRENPPSAYIPPAL